ncbi:hypothetical protein ACFQT0_29490 [Hymenobacter humi]|uniref:Beta-lactamase-inhibitor-like PepSY-like domain-containing protein n=1 Tax=Hymenobacter humi TaxID=1411620 RepID=A0ABW2UDN7_9BACT
MKTILLLCGILVHSIVGLAQQIPSEEVPPLAFLALQKQYPAASKVQWNRIHGLYEVHFVVGDDEHELRYRDNGDLDATVTAIETSALPAPIRQWLATRYPDLNFCKAAKVVNAASGEMTYEAEVCESSLRSIIAFTPEGKELRRPHKIRK